MEASRRNLQVRSPELRESTILVVDDEASGRELLSALLSSQGYRVRTAPDGFQALQIVAEGGIDLVLLDLMMSKMDGVEVCTQLRKNPQHTLLPVVFTTSLHDRASGIRAKEAGADDMLVKPIDGLELLVRVERLLLTRVELVRIQNERDRFAMELARLHAALGAFDQATSISVSPARNVEEMIREHRRLLADTLCTVDCTDPQAIATRLVELVRSAEELERRLTPLTTAFPLPQTRSTL